MNRICEDKTKACEKLLTKNMTKPKDNLGTIVAKKQVSETLELEK